MTADQERYEMDREPAELEFSFARFAEGFDLHIRQSIRGYAEMMSDCVAMSEYFLEDDTVAFDIGCSRGTLLGTMRKLNSRRCPGARYVGIDIEKSFADHWHGLAGEGVELCIADIRDFPVPANSIFVTCVFSLQFISERDRADIINRIYAALLPGRALVVAEKILSPSSKLNDIIGAIHHDFKRQSFSEQEIMAKDRSLRSMMKIWQETRVVESLQNAGFARDNVQQFWRNHNFAAFVALK